VSIQDNLLNFAVKSADRQDVIGIPRSSEPYDTLLKQFGMAKLCGSLNQSNIVILDMDISPGESWTDRS
jgi:hypothetical protein